MIALFVFSVFPTFSRTPSSTTVYLNESTELVCVASATLEVNYFWFRLGASGLVAVVLDDRVTENSGTLNFIMATFQDAGEYICAASNELGNITSRPARLTVQGIMFACDEYHHRL